MIRDILDLDFEAEIRGDVVVVGSGMAGTDLALQLARKGLSVILLESGRRSFDPAIQSLNDVRFVGKPHRLYTPGADFHTYLPRHYRGQNRIRQYGGTSLIWTGKWRPFLQGDLDGKPWIPNSDWPITAQELAPYYEAVGSDLGIPTGEQADRNFLPEARREELGRAGLQAAVQSWEARTMRVPERFGQELEGSVDVDLILGATVTELNLDDESRGRVVSATCKSLEGGRLTAKADHFVLATGGLEVPRLLLASHRQIAAGIGNANGLVGKYYQDHSKVQSGRLAPGPRMAEFADFVRTQPRPRSCLVFSLGKKVQERFSLLRHTVSLSPKYAGRLGRLLQPFRGGVACRDGLGLVREYKVTFASEQVPNIESRIFLGERRDALGMPEIVVDWRFTELDHRSVAETARELKAAFERAGLGALDLGDDPLTLDQMMDAAHPMGTTRMARSPDRGVVDPRCRVFGIPNLYIASSSVFPTGSVYSPTFTILALGRRIADHLVGASQAVGSA